MKRLREPEEEAQAEYSAQSSHTDDNGDAASPAAEVRVSKITELDESAIDDSTASTAAMSCSLPGHREPLSFRTYTEYEAHYIKAHTNRCSECRKNLPSDHLLNVHIEECHDSFAAVLREKGEHTYSCFVETCDRKCRTPQKRRMHLIDKHMYPKNFFFAVTKEGIDGRSSLLLESGHRRRRSSASTSQPSGHQTASNGQRARQAKTSEAQSTIEDRETGKSPQEIPSTSTTPAAEETVDTAMADLSSAMSTLQFVPTSVRFGRGKARTGFARR
ncbi:hypothetical protein BJ166DRAFT_590822 [Pestalotiopsis sp. NC0098]|nr:hypothetical protein BJ166DRAFT_590822 [Pestalotiopsis sp. NC0098]